MVKMDTFNTDISKAVHYIKNQGLWVLLGRAHLTVAGLLLSIILTRMMTKSEYGEYQYILSILAIFGFLSLPASTNVLIRYYGQGYHWAYLFFCMAVYSYFVGDIYFSLISLVFSVCFPLFYSCDLFEYLLQSEMEHKKLNIYYIVRESIRFVLVIFTYWMLGSIALTVIIYILSITMINSWLYYKVKKEYSIKYRGMDSKVQQKINTMAVNLSLVGILSLVASQIDKILIAKYIDPESLAIYSIGMLIGMSINMFFKSVLSIFNVKLVNHKVKFRHYLLIFIIGSIVGWLLTYVMSHVIVLVYGDMYHPSVVYTSIVLSSLGIYLASALYHNNLLYYNGGLENILYIGQILISSILMVLIFISIAMPVSNTIKLLFLSLMYPIKSILVVVIFFIVEKYTERNEMNCLKS